MDGSWKAPKGGTRDHEQDHHGGTGEMEFQHPDRCWGCGEGVSIIIINLQWFFFLFDQKRSKRIVLVTVNVESALGWSRRRAIKRLWGRSKQSCVRLHRRSRTCHVSTNLVGAHFTLVFLVQSVVLWQASFTGFACFTPEGVFDVLAYTDMDVAIPFSWIESDAKLINNPQMVKLHSFDTKVGLSLI